MTLKRWQLIWTLLNAIWLAAFAMPMLAMLRSDPEQAQDYLAFWVSLILLPTLVVYVFGLLFGRALGAADRGSRRSQPGSWQGRWLRVSVGWVGLVAAFALLAQAPLNPVQRFALPLAVAIVVLVALLPPLLLYVLGRIVDRFR